MATDDEQESKLWGRKADFFTILALAPFIFIGAYFGEVERGMTAACGAIALVLAVRVFWHLRNQRWFWIVMGILAVAHILIAIYLPWARNEFNAFALMPIGAVDFGITYCCIKLAEKLLD